MNDRGDSLALERATLNLVNAVAYTASSREHSRRFADATGIDLPTSDLRVLEFLYGRPPIAVSALATALRIDISQASRQVAQLAAAGHLRRCTDDADRRRTLVAVTPEASDALDRWLLSWAADYEVAVAGWSTDDLDDLERWLRVVLDDLERSLPGRPASAAPEQWRSRVGPAALPASTRRLVETAIALVAWVGQSGGYDDLLAEHDAPIRQHAYFTLRVVARNGPLSVAQVAERMGIERPQASKRLTQLTDLELVHRAVAPFDRRSTLVQASGKGVALLRAVRAAQLSDFASILPVIDEPERRRWTDLTRRYVEALFSAVIASRSSSAAAIR